MKKILVTGAAGFIGSKTCELLLKKNNQVVGIDNLNDYYDPLLKEYRLNKLRKSDNFEFHKIDIEDNKALRVLFSKHSFVAVINLAARAGVRYSMVNPHVYMTTNVLGLTNIIDEMKNQGTKKIILASTSSLYAGQEMPFSEDLSVNTPISPYAASKKAAEAICYTYHYLYKIDISILRYFTVYGPAGRPDMSYFKFIWAIDNNRPLTVYGDGSQARDFTFVDDIARGTVAAVKNVGFEIINLSGGVKPVTINFMIKSIENILGKKVKIIYKENNKADMKETWGDIRKAEKILNWKPETKFEKGIEETIKWYLNNKKLVNSFMMNQVY